MAKKTKTNTTISCDKKINPHNIAFDVSKYFATTIARGYKGLYIAPDVEILDIIKFLSKEIKDLIINTNCGNDHPFCVGNEITISVRTQHLGDILGIDCYDMSDEQNRCASLFRINTETRELTLLSMSTGSIRSFGNLCWKTGAVEVKIGNKSYRTRKELVGLGFFVPYHSTDKLPKYHVIREMFFSDTAVSDEVSDEDLD